MMPSRLEKELAEGEGKLKSGKRKFGEIATIEKRNDSIRETLKALDLQMKGPVTASGAVTITGNVYLGGLAKDGPPLVPEHGRDDPGRRLPGWTRSVASPGGATVTELIERTCAFRKCGYLRCAPAPTLAEVKALAAKGHVAIGLGDMVFAFTDARSARTTILAATSARVQGDLLVVSGLGGSFSVEIEDGVVIVVGYFPGGVP